MSTILPPGDSDPGDHDLLAAEYVLGLLQPDARRLAQSRLQREPAFAAEISRWESYFAPWLEAIPPVEVPSQLWARIRATLWQHELPERNAAATTQTRTTVWQSLSFWRGLSAAGAAIAVASLALVFVNLRPLVPASPPPPVVVIPTKAVPMVVSLRHDDGSTAYTATLDPASGTLTLVPVHLGGDASLSPELWLIPHGDQPHSLGMVEREKAMVVTIPVALRSAAEADGLFAITLEPAGSSAHQAPTGSVVAKGSSIRL